MRGKGLLAFIIYLLGTIVGIFFAGLAYKESLTAQGLEGFGVAFLLIIAIAVGLPSLVSLVVKILQILTGVKIFGVLCMILDVVVIASIVYNILTTTDNGNTLVEAATIIPTSLAFISNAFSLSD